MNRWILKVELNGEWEECYFPTRNDALSAFAALAEDYQKSLKRAILFTRSGTLSATGLASGDALATRQYVN